WREACARDAAAGEIDIVLHREAGKQCGNLVGAAQAAPNALIGRKVGNILAEEADGARRRQKVAGDAIEECGLASAIRTEYRAALARSHGNSDVGESRERAKQPCHAAKLECGAGADHRTMLCDTIHVPAFLSPALRRTGCATASVPTGRSCRRRTRTRRQGN